MKTAIFDHIIYNLVPFLLISILIQYYIFQTIKNPERVFYTLSMPKSIKATDSDSSKELNEKMGVNDDAYFSKKLSTFMKEEMPYLNPELKSHELAMMLEVTPHYLSKIINQEFNINFYNYVNQYRVEEFKKKVLKKESKNLTLTAVAQNAGFNSKSSFNRIFKSITSTTPTEYINQNIKQELSNHMA